MLYAALHNKISQKLWMDRVCPDVAPPVTHYLAGERVITLADRAPAISNRDEVPSLLDHGKAIFVKPADAGRGVGAYLAIRDGEGYRVNGESFDRPGIENWVRSLPLTSMISDVIEQADWAKRIFPKAVNTVRVLTATSSVDYRVVILGAAFRIATSRSAPTDNFLSGRGGLISPIDIESGLLGQCISFDERKFTRTLSDVHPETGVAVAGQTLPHWVLLRQTITKLAGSLPRPGLAGWDIALREEGITVVEINTLPGIDSVQTGGPLLDTEPKRNILNEFRMI